MKIYERPLGEVVPVVLAMALLATASACAEETGSRALEQYAVTEVAGGVAVLAGCVIKDSGLPGPFHFRVQTGPVTPGWPRRSERGAAAYMTAEGVTSPGLSGFSDPVTVPDLLAAFRSDDRSAPEGELYGKELPFKEGPVACGREVSTKDAHAVANNGDGPPTGVPLDELVGRVVTVSMLPGGQTEFRVVG